MTGFSQSALMQALGWATINSFWQAGALWCTYLLVRRFIVLTPNQQYKVAVAFLFCSVTAFFTSIFLYLQGAAQIVGPFLLQGGLDSKWFSAMLTAASFSYLLLFFVPTARLVQNWRFLRRLRRSQLAKAPVQYRLFVQKIGGHLGIRKTVQVHLSALVQSPVTIGFFKPLILLPVASFNQLTTQQAEAILLHELAHIRRFDYLVNISISLIQAVLYFNPFVHFFVRAVENSRETCCDKLVLQFDYDPFAYAGALLHLEKKAAPLSCFAMGATGKNQLLSRIEAIVGLSPKMPVLHLRHFTGLLASGLFVLALHSLLIVGEKNKDAAAAQTLAHLGNPFNVIYQDELPDDDVLKTPISKKTSPNRAVGANIPFIEYTVMPAPPPPPAVPATEPEFVQVAYTEPALTQLDAEEQAQVVKTVAATKNVLSKLEWKELEHAMADGLTAAEKNIAFEQYQEEVEQLNWKGVEDNLASHYDETNWEQLNQYLAAASHQIKVDSIEAVVEKTIIQLNELTKVTNLVAFPDQPIGTLKAYKQQVHATLDSIKAHKSRPMIRF